MIRTKVILCTEKSATENSGHDNGSNIYQRKFTGRLNTFLSSN
jgi:hypothetical protein